jgi:hypothetical protein
MTERQTYQRPVRIAIQACWFGNWFGVSANQFLNEAVLMQG